VLRKLSKARSLVRPDVPTVALLAPDGAGKSTVAQGVAESFFLPAQLVYMGLYQQKSAGGSSIKIPGIGLGLRLARQWLRYARARIHQAGGRLVLFDRYTYDAMLQTNPNEGTFSRWRRWLLAHSCPHADMVFMLDAPAEHLFERKQEHSVEALDEQRKAYRALRQRLPHMVIVDATKDVNEVRREVLSCIWRGCAKSRR
jgi:thymidylate kinase